MEHTEEKLVTIPESEYRELQKALRYLIDWDTNWSSKVKCPKCGYYHPTGYICLHCDNRQSH